MKLPRTVARDSNPSGREAAVEVEGILERHPRGPEKESLGLKAGPPEDGRIEGHTIRKKRSKNNK